MTAAGRLEAEFEVFKTEVEKRLSALESEKASTTSAKKTEKKTKDIVLETKNDDIIASETE